MDTALTEEIAELCETGLKLKDRPGIVKYLQGLDKQCSQTIKTISQSQAKLKKLITKLK